MALENHKGTLLMCDLYVLPLQCVYCRLATKKHFKSGYDYI